MGDGLWEVRSTLRNRREARVLFGAVGENMVLLHAFIKKSQRTPKMDLDLALRRLKDVKR